MPTNYTHIYLPDGQLTLPPVPGATWTDASAGQRGSLMRASVITLDVSSAVAWHRQRPLFQAIQTLAQSIPSSAFTSVTGLGELIDNWGGHSDTTNTGRYYAPRTGSGADWYLATGYIPFSSTAVTTSFIAGLRKNGSGTVAEGARIPSAVGHNPDTMVCDLVQLDGNATDYVELVAWQATGAAVNTVVVNKSPSFTVRWVAPDPAWFGAATPALPATPHVWTSADTWTASATGGAKVPMNVESRDFINFINNPPIARVTAQGTAQTIPNGGVWTSINFTTAGETVDSYGGWVIGSPSRYTCQRAGLYLIAGFANVQDPTSAAGYRACRLLHTIAAGGSTTYAGWSSVPPTASGTGTGLYATGLIRMAAGDYVEVQMAHTHTAALTLFNTAGNASRLVAVWMAA